MFLLPHWSFLHWEKNCCVRFRSFPVQSVSLLIAIIVSKAFMSKACMVVSGISCHCIWTNTDYYNNKKRCLPALSKFLEYWPEKLIIFVCLALSTEPYKQVTLSVIRQLLVTNLGTCQKGHRCYYVCIDLWTKNKMLIIRGLNVKFCLLPSASFNLLFHEFGINTTTAII